MRFLALILLILSLNFAHAEDAAKLVGTWKLVSWVNVDDETKEEKKLYGEHPKGYLILLPSKRMMALLTAESRKVPQTDEERASALKSMISYTGKYRIEGNNFTTTVDAAWNEAWVGTEQKRTFTLEGGKLTIITMSQPSVNFGGKVAHGVLVWEREK
jgi:hypothetical protein